MAALLVAGLVLNLSARVRESVLTKREAG